MLLLQDAYSDFMQEVVGKKTPPTARRDDVRAVAGETTTAYRRHSPRAVASYYPHPHQHQHPNKENIDNLNIIDDINHEYRTTDSDNSNSHPAEAVAPPSNDNKTAGQDKFNDDRKVVKIPTVPTTTIIRRDGANGCGGRRPTSGVTAVPPTSSLHGADVVGVRPRVSCERLLEEGRNRRRKEAMAGGGAAAAAAGVGVAEFRVAARCVLVGSSRGKNMFMWFFVLGGTYRIVEK